MASGGPGQSTSTVLYSGANLAIHAHSPSRTGKSQPIHPTCWIYDAIFQMTKNYPQKQGRSDPLTWRCGGFGVGNADSAIELQG